MYTSYLHNRKSQPKQCLLPWSGVRSASPQWGCWVSVTAMPVVLIIKPVITHDPGGAGQLALHGHTQRQAASRPCGLLWHCGLLTADGGATRNSSDSCSMAREWRVEHMHGGSQHGKQWQAKVDTYIHILLVMTNYICMNIWCLLILITSNWSTSPHA